MRKAGASAVGYTNPEKLSKQILSNVRNKKDQDAELRAKLTAQARNEFPSGTDEAINAIVTRQIYEMELASRVPKDPELTLRPDLKKTLKKDIVVEKYHSGKYEVDRFSKNGKKVWSCSRSTDPNAPGCVIKKVDKQKWNVDGY